MWVPHSKEQGQADPRSTLEGLAKPRAKKIWSGDLLPPPTSQDLGLGSWDQAMNSCMTSRLGAGAGGRAGGGRGKSCIENRDFVMAGPDQDAAASKLGLLCGSGGVGVRQ